MKKQESRVLKRSGQLWDEFLKLEKKESLHPDDLGEFRHHLHAIQNIILSRTELRKMKYKKDFK